MRVNVLISTVDRPESLKNTVDSIFDGEYKDVCVSIMQDGNISLSRQLNHNPVRIFLNKVRMDYVYSMNRLLQESEDTDGVVYASDDLTFPADGISKVVEAMDKHFPDGDGLVGLNQSCAGIDSAFGLIGRKFIERFPERQVFCPDYLHFVSDAELGAFAKSIGKFHFCKEVVLGHERNQYDMTFTLGMAKWGLDILTHKKRMQEGFLWGSNFGLVGNGQ